MRLDWPAVLAWRLRRQFLLPPVAGDPVQVVRRLCGVQAQLAGAAQLAVQLRQADPEPAGVARALAERRLVKTWAMRGTLHLLASDEAPSYLAVSAASRAWTSRQWQRTFLPADQLERLAKAVAEFLPGRVLLRSELADEVARSTGDQELAEAVRSHWSAVLKPLAWQGILCFGPDPGGGRVTFTSPSTWLPGWAGIAEPAEAAELVLSAYLGAHGPARLGNLDQFLSRGLLGKRTLRQWLDGMAQVRVAEVEGEPCYLLAEHEDEIAASPPVESTLLLPAFDQYLLGPGTTDPQLVPSRHRPAVSRPGGWIAPVVVHGGRVAGTWERDQDVVTVVPFDDVRLPERELAAAVSSLAERLGHELSLSIGR